MFRRWFLHPLSIQFVQILEISHKMDLVKLGEVSIDGTKVKTNASKHKAMSWKRVCQVEDQLSEEVAELIDKAEQVEDDHSLPKGILRQTDRLGQIRQVKAMIEERAAPHYEEEKASHEQKMADRPARKTGKKTPMRPPTPP